MAMKLIKTIGPFTAYNGYSSYPTDGKLNGGTLYAYIYKDSTLKKIYIMFDTPNSSYYTSIAESARVSLGYLFGSGSYKSLGSSNPTGSYIEIPNPTVGELCICSGATTESPIVIIKGTLKDGFSGYIDYKSSDWNYIRTGINYTGDSFWNEAPTTPTSLVLSSGSLIGGKTVSFTASGSTDENGDTITYYYEYSYDNSAWTAFSSPLTLGTDRTKTTLYIRTSSYDGKLYSAYLTKTFSIKYIPRIYAKVNGMQKEYSDGYLKVNGIWVTISEVYVKVNGAWVKSQ